MLIAAALGVWLLGALREMHVWNPTCAGGRSSARREGVACRPSPYAEQSADTVGQFLPCDGVIYIFTCVASSNVKFQIDAAGRPPIAALVSTSRPEP